jgi:hypothetical protein
VPEDLLVRIAAVQAMVTASRGEVGSAKRPAHQRTGWRGVIGAAAVLVLLFTVAMTMPTRMAYLPWILSALVAYAGVVAVLFRRA